MQTKVISNPLDEIVDWNSFHTVFKETLGFPDYYGRNMDAWIDCMTYVDNPQMGMVDCPVQSGELLTLRLPNAAAFRDRCPDLYEALIECAAFVNYRRVDVGEEPVLSLLIEGWFDKPTQ